MGAEGAVNILYRKELADAADPQAKAAELAERYRDRVRFALSLGGARLHHRRDRARRDALGAGAGAAQDAVQARAAAGQEARQHPALTGRLQGQIDDGGPLHRRRCSIYGLAIVVSLAIAAVIKVIVVGLNAAGAQAGRNRGVRRTR